MNKLFVLILFFIIGCGGKIEAPKDAVQTVTPPIDTATAGTLQGTVFFKGQAPKPRKLKIAGNPECSMMVHGNLYSEELVTSNGKLQNAIVFIKEGLEDYQFPIPEESVLIDQKNCTFVPHVVAAHKYQKIELLNSDPTLHNVNAKSKNSRGFNIGFPSKGMKRLVSFSADELHIPIRCDLHPWMKGFIAVFDHPYFQVTGPDGSFSFSPLPPGKYTVAVWHEKLGSQTQVMEIKPKKTKDLRFTFSLEDE